MSDGEWEESSTGGIRAQVQGLIRVDTFLQQVVINLFEVLHPRAQMIIPNADKAIVDIRKLRDYCLNPQHDEGKHKARLFLASLGMTANDAEALREILLEVVKTYEAQLGGRDDFGQRYRLDFALEWQNRSATLRSGWIIEHGSEVPKLTTCFPL